MDQNDFLLKLLGKVYAESMQMQLLISNMRDALSAKDKELADWKAKVSKSDESATTG